MQSGDQWDTREVPRVWLIVAAMCLGGCVGSGEAPSTGLPSSAVIGDPDSPVSLTTTEQQPTTSLPSQRSSAAAQAASALPCVEEGWSSIDALGVPVDGVVLAGDTDDRTRLCDAETGAMVDLGVISYGQVGLAPVGSDSVVVVDFSGPGGAWSAWRFRLVGDRWSEVAPIEPDVGDDRLVAGLHCQDEQLVRSVVDPFAADGSMTIIEEVVGDVAGGSVGLFPDDAWADAVESVQLECGGALLAPPRRLSLQIALMLVESAGGVVLPGDHVIDPVAVASAERDGLGFSVGVDLSGERPESVPESVWVGLCPFGLAVIVGESPERPAPDSIVADVARAGRCVPAGR